MLIFHTGCSQSGTYYVPMGGGLVIARIYFEEPIANISRVRVYLQPIPYCMMDITSVDIQTDGSGNHVRGG